MELSPHQIRTASFSASRKGYDPQEVGSFLEGAAGALEAAQNHSTAMEAKARAAVAKLQELAAAGPVRPSDDVAIPPDRAEQISRILLLAQRAADDVIDAAREEAERTLDAARVEATSTLESSRETAAAMVDEARADARSADLAERARARSEVEALLAQREFLVSDVMHLEKFLVEQRERLHEAAATLVDLADRVPGGLGHLRAPLLSAVIGPDDVAPDVDSDATAELLAGSGQSDDLDDVDRVDDRSDGNGSGSNDELELELDLAGVESPDDDVSSASPGQSVPPLRPLDHGPDDPTPATDSQHLRFRPQNP